MCHKGSFEAAYPACTCVTRLNLGGYTIATIE